MSAESYLNGHRIEFSGREWTYVDTGKPTINSKRACGKCNKWPVNDHDACIVDLPGVMNACCGHGVVEGYIQFESGVIIRGKFEIEVK